MVVALAVVVVVVVFRVEINVELFFAAGAEVVDVVVLRADVNVGLVVVTGAEIVDEGVEIDAVALGSDAFIWPPLCADDDLDVVLAPPKLAAPIPMVIESATNATARRPVCA